MPSIIINHKDIPVSFHYKSLFELQGALHCLLKNRKNAILHNRDLGMNSKIDINDIVSLKRIFKAHNIKSFYKRHNTLTINNYFSDASLDKKLLEGIEKIDIEGIWIVPDYGISFYPFYIMNHNQLKEFIDGYNKLASELGFNLFNHNLECVRNVSFITEGLYLASVEL